MEYLISGREPQAFFRFFEEICSIPHGSGNESAIADYLCSFAQSRSLEYSRDGLNNVLIKKPAHPDKADRPTVLLQAHSDMVCEKLPTLEHDFTTEPLKLKVEGDILSACGTTLGGDDGVGVAAMLTALDDASLVAPALECLFTVSEETGMDGALGFDYNQLTARNVVNLDNTDEGNACCGCAGGVDLHFSLPCEYAPMFGKAVAISVSGLAGGHSGVDIDRGRQNAVKLLSKALLSLYQTAPFCLLTMSGGVKPNVIPSSATAIVAFFGTAEAKAADKHLRAFFAAAKQNLCREDRGVKYSFKNVPADALKGDDAVIPKNKDFPVACLTYKSTNKLLSLLSVCPSGVLKYMPDDKSQILSSVNPGVLRHDGECFKLLLFARSCFDCENEETVSVLRGLGKLYGANVDVKEPTPGWKYVRGGELQKCYDRACRAVLGKPAVFENIHAGLECGVIIAAMNAIDGAENAQAISIGPNLRNIHSSSESLELSSCSRFYEIIKHILASI
ncbi:MAG: beta-Ala-His dipeptidase [Clostridia bacterium]|nr:beta-Ala-His dipeptidase [Clostridia bacterium]